MKPRFHFALQKSFLGQQLTFDGKPFGPIKYKELVREAYILAKHCNISYSEVMNMTPTERQYMLEFLKEDMDREKESLNKIKKQQEERRSR